MITKRADRNESYKTLLATNATSKQQYDAQDALLLASSGPFAPLGKRGTGPCAWLTVALSNGLAAVVQGRHEIA
jgi:hypothetical protein